MIFCAAFLFQRLFVSVLGRERNSSKAAFNPQEKTIKPPLRQDSNKYHVPIDNQHCIENKTSEVIKQTAPNPS